MRKKEVIRAALAVLFAIVLLPSCSDNKGLPPDTLKAPSFKMGVDEAMGPYFMAVGMSAESGAYIRYAISDGSSSLGDGAGLKAPFERKIPYSQEDVGKTLIARAYMDGCKTSTEGKAVLPQFMTAPVLLEDIKWSGDWRDPYVTLYLNTHDYETHWEYGIDNKAVPTRSSQEYDSQNGIRLNMENAIGKYLMAKSFSDIGESSVMIVPIVDPRPKTDTPTAIHIFGEGGSAYGIIRPIKGSETDNKIAFHYTVTETADDPDPTDYMLPSYYQAISTDEGKIFNLIALEEGKMPSSAFHMVIGPSNGKTPNPVFDEDLCYLGTAETTQYFTVLSDDPDTIIRFEEDFGEPREVTSESPLLRIRKEYTPDEVGKNVRARAYKNGCFPSDEIRFTLKQMAPTPSGILYKGETLSEESFVLETEPRGMKKSLSDPDGDTEVWIKFSMGASPVFPIPDNGEESDEESDVWLYKGEKVKYEELIPDNWYVNIRIRKEGYAPSGVNSVLLKDLVPLGENEFEETAEKEGKGFRLQNAEGSYIKWAIIRDLDSAPEELIENSESWLRENGADYGEFALYSDDQVGYRVIAMAFRDGNLPSPLGIFPDGIDGRGLRDLENTELNLISDGWTNTEGGIWREFHVHQAWQGPEGSDEEIRLRYVLSDDQNPDLSLSMFIDGTEDSCYVDYDDSIGVRYIGKEQGGTTESVGFVGFSDGKDPSDIFILEIPEIKPQDPYQ